VTRSALVLRALGLGDFFTGVPALRLIRSALPDAQLWLAGPAHLGELARDAGLVDQLIDYSGLIDLGPLPTSPLGGGHPLDIAIDLHGNGPASRDVLRACNPERLIAYAIGPEPDTTLVWDPEEHEVARWCRLISAAFGVDGAAGGEVAGSLPRPERPADLPAKAIVVHPGASARSRQWPADRFVAVAQQLHGYGHRVVVTGSGSERELVDQVARAAGATPLVDLDLRALLGLIGHAALLVCGDTGVAHVASTYRTPSVVLFGPVSPARWGPPPSPLHRPLYARRPEDPPGNPHGTAVDPALLHLGVDAVLRACQDLLATPTRRDAAA
jgi:ADP-heptose:LPS heptosyltransferase